MMPATKGQRRIYQVSEITRDIKLILEQTFGGVWVEGEVSNCRPSSAGHCYFSLKDASAVLGAVMFSRTLKDTKFKLEDGQKVICYGNVEVYPPHGRYQLIVERIEPKGIGSLQLALEQLKERLEKEGLFALPHKKAIPYLPSRIGVVTSLQGAAVRDILKVLAHRFEGIHVVITPVRVQGEGAGEEIAAAIKDCNDYNRSVPAGERLDVMIVGRGGGSIEDLWAFNEEVVARAIYSSAIPVISAVGHERDWTIADLVADMRAPTPSAAAEMAVPEKQELRETIGSLTQDLGRALDGTIAEARESVAEYTHRAQLAAGHRVELAGHRLDAAHKKLMVLNPALLIVQHRKKITDAAGRINSLIEAFCALRRAQFRGVAEKLESLSPLQVLGRGYSITFALPQGKVVREAQLLHPGDPIKTRLHRGEITSTVTEVKGDG